MAAARPPIYVLDRVVNTGYHANGKPAGLGWWEIPCASRKAYGCGDHIQEVLDGLVLYARLGDGPLLTSSLAIRMSEGARRRFQSELKIDPEGPFYGDLVAYAVVEMAEEQGVTTIVLSVRRRSRSSWVQRPLSYYLVYDATDRSLSIFQIGGDDGVCTRKPIVPKRTSGGDYKLLFLGQDEHRSSSDRKDGFWVGSLSMSSDGGTPVMSKLKSMDFLPGLIHEPFNVDVAFSFQGKCFWGDLEQGLVYCDLQTMDFGFVELPSKCMVDVETAEFPKPMRNTRTMGCAGDSIWFVSIEIPSHYSNAAVWIWELGLPGKQPEGERKEVQWTEFDEVPFKVLWGLSSFRDSGLPVEPFQFPILTADGALCLVLVEQGIFPRREHPLVYHFCSFDMRCKRLLSHGLVRNYPITDSIIMHPSSNFLEMKPDPCNMSFAEDCPAAGLKAMAGGEHCRAAGPEAMDRGEDCLDAGPEAMAGRVREAVLLYETMAGRVREPCIQGA